MKLVYLPQAQADLDAIHEPLLSRVRKRLDALRRYPQLGLAMAGPFAGRRSTVVEFFRIVYEERRGLLIVLYIRHCRRP